MRKRPPKVAMLTILQTSEWWWVLLFSAFLILSSTSKYKDEWQGLGPPLAVPFEAVCLYGRGLAITLLGVITILSAFKKLRSRANRLPALCQFMIAVQAVITVKSFSVGAYESGVIAAFTYPCLWVVYMRVLPRIARHGADGVRHSAEVMFFALSLFVLINFYVYVRSPAGAMACQGRFHGITSNPQWFALSVGICFPAIAYLVRDPRSSAKMVRLALLVGGGSLLLVFATGSRLALLLVFVGALPFVPAFISAPIALAGGLVWALDIDPSSLLDFGEYTPRVLTRSEDTRGAVWTAMWRQFMRDPIFGSLEARERLAFGESSWLSLLANTGIVGAVPAVLLVIRLIALLGSAYRASVGGASFGRRLDAKWLVGTLSCILVGSSFEAFLCGILTMPLVLTLLLFHVANGRSLEGAE